MPIEHIAHTPSKVQHAQAGRAARVTQQKLERGNGVLFNHHWPQTKHHPSLTVVTTLSNLDLIYKRGVLSVHPPADGSGLKGVDAGVGRILVSQEPNAGVVPFVELRENEPTRRLP